MCSLLHSICWRPADVFPHQLRSICLRSTESDLAKLLSGYCLWFVCKHQRARPHLLVELFLSLASFYWGGYHLVHICCEHNCVLFSNGTNWWSGSQFFWATCPAAIIWNSAPSTTKGCVDLQAKSLMASYPIYGVRVVNDGDNRSSKGLAKRDNGTRPGKVRNICCGCIIFTWPIGYRPSVLVANTSVIYRTVPNSSR